MGSQSSSSNSRPLSADERSTLYDAAVNKVTGSDALTNNLADITYDSPTYQSAGGYKGISNGDYNQLQADLLDGYTAGIDYDKSKAMSNLNNDLAKRGIWSSGAAIQAENDLNNSYAGAYGKAGADATSSRFSLESADKQAENAFNTSQAAAANSFNQTEANTEFNNKYRPYDYLAGIWNGTGGTVSSGSSGGWSI